jgi:peptidoglycan hydrolase CwlO-like protein
VPPTKAKLEEIKAMLEATKGKQKALEGELAQLEDMLGDKVGALLPDRSLLKAVQQRRTVSNSKATTILSAS